MDLKIRNPFLRELARSALVGFGAAAAFVIVILALDFAHLRALTFGSSDGPLAIGLLFFFSGLTFSSAQMAFRIFPLLDGDADDPRRRSDPRREDDADC